MPSERQSFEGAHAPVRGFLIAGAATFLASDDAHWVTGEALKVAGGNR